SRVTATVRRRSPGIQFRDWPNEESGMAPQNFTERVQSSLQDAQAEATRRGHQAVDVEHLAVALLRQDDGLFAQLLQRMRSDRGFLEGSLEKALDRAPRVAGPGAAPGELYVSQRLSRLLV